MINYIYLLIYTLIKITIKIKMFDLFEIKKREKQKKNMADDVMNHKTFQKIKEKREVIHGNANV